MRAAAGTVSSTGETPRRWAKRLRATTEKAETTVPAAIATSHSQKLSIAKKQPKSMPSIDSYSLLKNGDIPGTNGGRLVVLGVSHQPGGEIRPSNP